MVTSLYSAAAWIPNSGRCFYSARVDILLGLKGSRARPSAVNRTLARRLMERTQIYSALKKGFRGRGPIDLAALEDLLVRFSQLVIEQRWIKEIDINPLLVSPKQIVALDARVVLHDSQIAKPICRHRQSGHTRPIM